MMDSISYIPSELAKFFHSLPRYDIKFSPVSSKFDPDDKQYQESLLLIAAVPVLWMLLWILIYMVYFCYFCVTCRRRNIEKTKRSVRPTRWCSFFFTILTILVVAAAIFSSELVSYSLKSATSNANKISNGTDVAAVQSAVILRSIDVLKNETEPQLMRAFKINTMLDENDRPYLIGSCTLLRSFLVDASQLVQQGLQQPLKQIDIDSTQFSTLVDKYESYRRIATGVFSGFLMVTSSLALCALGSKRKAFLLACVAICVFNLILVWIAAGFYAALATATSDFCVEPTEYITDSSASLGMSVSERYYLECQPAVNPFHDMIVSVQAKVEEAEDSLSAMFGKSDILTEETLANISSALDDLLLVKKQLLMFSSSTDCAASNRYYMSALVSICQASLVGETAVLGSFTAAGIFLIILVFLIHTAARFNSNSKTRKPQALNMAPRPLSRRNRRAYYEVDSQDIDYQSRGENTRSDNPLYYRFSQISTNEDNTRVPVATSSASGAVQPSAPSRSSPPPAYQNHKDFYSTYGNNGTLDSNTRVPTASNDLNRNSNTFRT